MALIDSDNVKQVLAALVAKAEPPSRPIPDDVPTFPAEPAEAEPAFTATGPAPSRDGVARDHGSALLDEPTRSVLESAAPGLLATLDALTRDTRVVAATAATTSDQEAVAMLRAAEVLRRSADSLFTTITARFERLGTPDHLGVRSPRALLMQQLRISGPEASRRIRLGRTLGERTSITGEQLPPEHPHIAARLHAGDINTDQAQAMLTTLTRLPPALRADHQEQAEALLVSYAGDLTVKDLHTAGQRIIEHLDPDGTCPVDTPDPQNYALTLTALPSGDYRIRGFVDGLTGTTLATLIEERIKNTTGNTDAQPASSDPATAGTAHAQDAAGSTDSSVDGISTSTTTGHQDPFESPPDRIGTTTTGDPSAVSSLFVQNQRTSHQQRYDAFCSLIRDAGAHRNAHGPAFALVITATAEQLARGTGTATTHNRTPVPVGTVLQHACTAKIYLHSWDADHGTIAVRTENRLANKNQLTLLAARDQGCSFPDCDVEPVYCQAHHMQPHAQGGPTDINNLTLVCPYHHAWHDPNGWTARLIDGLPAWIPPPHLDPRQQPIHHSKFRIQLIPQLTDLLTLENTPTHQSRPSAGEHRPPKEDWRPPLDTADESPPRTAHRTLRNAPHSNDIRSSGDGWLTEAPPPRPPFNDPNDIPPF
jgi:hypothetical protein